MSNINFQILEKIPKYNLLKNKIKNKKIIVRVNMNVQSMNGLIADPIRLDNTKEIIKFLLSEGATPILIAHNGRLIRSSGIDKRQSLATSANYIQNKLFPDEKIIFHNDSLAKDSREEGLRISKDQIIDNAVNII